MTSVQRNQDLSLLPRWRAGELTLGAWFMLPCGIAVEAVARLGFDFVVVDMQHGCMGYEGAVEMIRAADVAGVVPIARVPWSEPGIIGRMLDAGALGIIVPMIETAEDARRAVDAALYPPAGRRSLGAVRANARDGAAYRLNANDRVAVLPMIETRSAVEHVDAIAQTPGVSGVLLGPSDLSIALGLPPGDNDGDPQFDDAVLRIVGACKRAGKVAAAFSNAKSGPRRIEQGFQMVSVAVDITALTTGCAASLEAVRPKSAGRN